MTAGKVANLTTFLVGPTCFYNVAETICASFVQLKLFLAKGVNAFCKAICNLPYQPSRMRTAA